MQLRFNLHCRKLAGFCGSLRARLKLSGAKDRRSGPSWDLLRGFESRVRAANGLFKEQYGANLQ